MSKKVPLCEICGVKPAEFVCRECGRLVCRDHYDMVLGVCSECAKKYYHGYEPKSTGSHISSFILIFLGISLIFIGFILMSLSYLTQPLTGLKDIVVIIGPLPILMTGKTGLFIGLVYILAIIIFFYILIRKFF